MTPMTTTTFLICVYHLNPYFKQLHKITKPWDNETNRRFSEHLKNYKPVIFDSKYGKISLKNLT
ncbi:hypothetical protein ADIARSV_3263 [Arcticibacter svalbardensis MN12-7]|uniref:Uncharacterized protein n=1 Tax=Arcticibacter svalbardensis MN12-7 TaxID=1150600 RepID=R9GPT6_9SPHI|nr:hypothetical protein ADIARSV_3263 [Arcticibacter svalbardensis MN12-7]